MRKEGLDLNKRYQHPISVIGPVEHRVYQRNEQSKANIAFELVLSGAIGKVEARAVSDDTGMEWQYVGEAQGTTFTGTLRDIAVGQYRLEFRIGSDPILGSCAVDPVFVGDLWILAGQSNMQGCGKLIDMEQPEAGISCFYMGDRWGVAEEPLCWLNESIDPVHWCVPEKDLSMAILEQRRDRVQGTGLGLSFAKEVRKHSGVPIGLIMCAHGGTSMEQWDPSLAGLEGRSLYGTMLRKVRKLGGKVKGCLWYQGESDTLAELVPLYSERMKTWVSKLRQDVDDSRLPFIYAQLSVLYIIEPDARWMEPRLWNFIQQNQLELEKEIPNSAMVPTIDAGLADAIHLDTASLRILGQRMAWQALRLAYGQAVAEIGPRPAKWFWNEYRTELIISFNGMNGRLAFVDKVLGFRVEKNEQSYGLIASLTEDRRSIRLRFELPIPAESELRYGAGFNPTVNVKDEKGIPLAVFGLIRL